MSHREFESRWEVAPMPYQVWEPFPEEAIVQVKNAFGESKIAIAKKLWWGWEPNNHEGVISQARRLDRIKID
jgi:hypothetical protein